MVGGAGCDLPGVGVSEPLEMFTLSGSRSKSGGLCADVACALLVAANADIGM